MRIERSRTRLSFRRPSPRRRGGCLSLVVSVGLIAGVAAVGWLWFNRLWGGGSASAPPDVMRSAYNAFERGDLTGALSLSTQRLNAAPTDPEALILAVRALIYRSYSEYNRAFDRQTAIQLATEHYQAAPTDPHALAAYAFAVSSEGNAAGAAEAARLALERIPNHALALTALALAHSSAGSHETALRESLAASANSSPFLVDALRAQAISQRDLGDYAAALRTVARAIEIAPKLIPLYFEQAQYALLLGDGDAATVAYFQVFVTDPENVKARLRLCELSSLMRERDMAVRYCGEVVERAPSWYEGWYRLGMEYFYQGAFEDAQRSLRRCSSLQVMQNISPADLRFECWYIQGQAAEIRGDCTSLVAIYNEFRTLAADPQVQQRWTYPPEGPPGC